jgi:hypothetical protein
MGNFWIAEYNGGGYGAIVTLFLSDGTVFRTFTRSVCRPQLVPPKIGLSQPKMGFGREQPDNTVTVSKGHFADGTVFSLNLGFPPAR